MEGSFFFERNQDRVYVAADSSEFVSDYLVRAIDRRLDGMLGHQSATLLRIVDADPARIDSMLTKLKVSQLREEVPARIDEEPAADDGSTMTFADTQDELDLVDEDWVSSDVQGDAERDESHDSVDSSGEADAEASTADTASKRRDGRSEEAGPDEVSATADARTPPGGTTRPATARRTSQPMKSSRFVTYVAQQDETKRPQSPEQVAQRQKVEVSGIDHVRRHEEAAQRTVRMMPPNHEGYDLESCDDSGAIVRYIEVKSTAGQWGADGVGLTSPEFSCAQRLGEAYWLYVVEFADTGEARIHRIMNPAGRSKQFYFDRGWIGVREEDA